MSSPAASGSRSKGEAEAKQHGTFFLGRYRVVDEIGVGGMASVHLGRMDGPGGFQKWVAIKRIHPHLVEDDQFVDMFLDEARIAAGINHANVAQVFDLGKDDNTYWIAMEYLHGEPLREVMRRAEDRKMRISPELASRICADAAEGLHAAHELRGKNGQLLGLVHRDVTPHNLFLTYDGYTKVVDFGIAKVADRLSSTRAGTLKGKLAYMSPEQVRGAEVDRTTDIFALGVVLWELTTNQRLFRMDTDLDTLEKVQACVVPPPTSVVPDFPVELEAIVLKALAKRKQDRFQTAREFSRALQNFLMRRGAFVGPEEVAQFVRHVFADRIQKREAHLAWAAEVTSTINVDVLRAQQAGKGGLPDEASEVSASAIEEAPRGGPPPAPLPPKGQGPPPPARPAPAPQASPPPSTNMSLMDDDEDVPTTVATRDQLEAADAATRGLAAAQGPRPASGGGPAPQPFGGFRPNGAGPQPFGGAAGFGQPPGGFPARPGGGEDLGSTVALDMRAAPASPLASQHFGQPQHQQQPQPYAQHPHQGMGYAPPPGIAPMGGQPMAPYGYAPMQGYPAQQPMNYPPPQSQIETAMSLPRPDPAAVWLAQQERQRGERRNTGVLVAVVALTALCVIGIGALVYLKIRSAPTAPAPEATPTAAAETPSSGAATAEAPAAREAPPPPSATGTSRATEPAPARPGPGGHRTQPAVKAPAGEKPDRGAEKEEPGFLTIMCNPGCEEVIDQGRSLGPAPVVRLQVKPGQHRITLKNAGITKVISVIVVSGQVTAQRVTMK